MAVTPFEAAVRRILAPRLRELGFERAGSHGYRNGKRALDGIHLQQDRYNLSEVSCFTINLASIRLPFFMPASMLDPLRRSLDLFADTPGPGNRKKTIRIGRVTEIGEDYWYPYRNVEAGECDAVVHEALDDIERYAIPWMESGKRPRLDPDPSRIHAAEARHAAMRAALFGGAEANGQLSLQE